MRKYFEELNMEAFAGRTVILDIDGTLVADSTREVANETLAAVAELKRHCSLSLASNHLERSRNSDLARALGLPLLHESFRKPFFRLVRHTRKNTTGEIVVIGDKFLTDGIFALFLGAEFVRVRRKLNGKESLLTRVAYFTDAVMGRVMTWMLAMRCYHWIKNLLVFLPLFFVGEFFNVQLLTKGLLAFVSFSLLSSIVYIVNDLADRAQDRSHPRKRLRPIASGDIGLFEAIVLVAFLAALLGYLLTYVIPEITLVLAVYFLLNLLYSFALKHVPIVDIVLVAVFYLLRIHVGGVATAIPISPWLNLTAFFLSLFVITGKRLAESRLPHRRKVLERYTADFLSHVLLIATALSLSVYGAYSVLAYDSPLLVYTTIPFAVGVLRYLQLTHSSPEAEHPELLLLRDPLILSAVAVWGVLFLSVVYL